MGIFRRNENKQTEPELVDLPVGFDRTAAAMIVARCESEGIPIRLLTMDDNGLTPGLPALQEHRVLIRVEDQERVERIAQRRHSRRTQH